MQTFPGPTVSVYLSIGGQALLSLASEPPLVLLPLLLRAKFNRFLCWLQVPVPRTGLVLLCSSSCRVKVSAWQLRKSTWSGINRKDTTHQLNTTEGVCGNVAYRNYVYSKGLIPPPTLLTEREQTSEINGKSFICQFRFCSPSPSTNKFNFDKLWGRWIWMLICIGATDNIHPRIVISTSCCIPEII